MPQWGAFCTRLAGRARRGGRRRDVVVRGAGELRDVPVGTLDARARRRRVGARAVVVVVVVARAARRARGGARVGVLAPRRLVGGVPVVTALATRLLLLVGVEAAWTF